MSTIFQSQKRLLSGDASKMKRYSRDGFAMYNARREDVTFLTLVIHSHRSSLDMKCLNYAMKRLIGRKIAKQIIKKLYKSRHVLATKTRIFEEESSASTGHTCERQIFKRILQ